MEKDEKETSDIIQQIKTANLLLDSVNIGIDGIESELMTAENGVPRLDLSSFNKNDVSSTDDENSQADDVTKSTVRVSPVTSSSSSTRIPSIFTCDSLCSFPWKSRRVFNQESSLPRGVGRNGDMTKIHDHDRIPSVFYATISSRERGENPVAAPKPMCLKPVAAHRRSVLRDRLLLQEEDPNVIQWFPRPKEELQDLLGSSSNNEIQLRRGGVSWRIRHENARKHPATGSEPSDPAPVVKQTGGKSPQARDNSVAKFHPYNKARPIRAHGPQQESTAAVHVDHNVPAPTDDAMGGGESCDVTKKPISDSDNDGDASEDGFETDSLTFTSPDAATVTSSPGTSSSSTSSVGVCEEEISFREALKLRSLGHRSPSDTARKFDSLAPTNVNADKRAYGWKGCNVRNKLAPVGSYATSNGSARTGMEEEHLSSESSCFDVGDSPVSRRRRRRRKTRGKIFEELREFSRTFERMRGEKLERRQRLQHQLTLYSSASPSKTPQPVSPLQVYRSSFTFKLRDVISKLKFRDVVAYPARKLKAIVSDLFDFDEFTCMKDEITRISKMIRRVIKEEEESSERSGFALSRFVCGCNWDLRKEIVASCIQFLIFTTLYICIFAFIISVAFPPR